MGLEPSVGPAPDVFDHAIPPVTLHLLLDNEEEEESTTETVALAPGASATHALQGHTARSWTLSLLEESSSLASEGEG